MSRLCGSHLLPRLGFGLTCVVFHCCDAQTLSLEHGTALRQTLFGDAFGEQYGLLPHSDKGV